MLNIYLVAHFARELIDLIVLEKIVRAAGCRLLCQRWWHVFADHKFLEFTVRLVIIYIDADQAAINQVEPQVSIWVRFEIRDQRICIGACICEF